jgi:hypothetical protein
MFAFLSRGVSVFEYLSTSNVRSLAGNYISLIIVAITPGLPAGCYLNSFIVNCLLCSIYASIHTYADAFLYYIEANAFYSFINQVAFMLNRLRICFDKQLRVIVFSVIKLILVPRHYPINSVVTDAAPAASM